MSDQIYLTKNGLERLNADLEALRKRRREVAQRIHTAKEFGDLSENSEYEDAKNEQAFVEGRILELQEMIKRARVVLKNGNGKIELGSTVILKIDGTSIEYTLVGASESDPSTGKISIESPLGYSLVGKTKGEKVETQTPNGKITYQILEIK